MKQVKAKLRDAEDDVEFRDREIERLNQKHNMMENKTKRMAERISYLEAELEGQKAQTMSHKIM